MTITAVAATLAFSGVALASNCPVLIKQGKDFDFVFSPSATHAWDKRPDTAAYLFHKLLDHFDRYVGPGPR